MSAVITDFRRLEAWSMAMDLVVDVYALTEALPASERYGLTSQIRRAAVSIVANIAEGHNRRSARGYHFHVTVALGSQAELDTLIELIVRLGYCRREDCQSLSERLKRVGQMLHALVRSLERSRHSVARPADASPRSKS
jgi:four helix bundle protein